MRPYSFFFNIADFVTGFSSWFTGRTKKLLLTLHRKANSCGTIRSNTTLMSQNDDLIIVSSGTRSCGSVPECNEAPMWETWA